jgi:hypothetical protein
VSSPVPAWWFDAGAPPEAFALLGEGWCPVHRCPLDPQEITVGKLPWRQPETIPAGWCERCRAHWRFSWDEESGERMIGATWDTGAGR